MTIRGRIASYHGSGEGAFSLQEVVFSMGIAAVAIGGLITGHSVSSQRALWATYSQAAQLQAVMRLEQTRVARWDPSANPQIDELVATNFPVLIDALDVPSVGTNSLWATNTTTISQVSASPPLRMVRVDCVWQDLARRLQTNTVVAYRVPEL